MKNLCDKPMNLKLEKIISGLTYLFVFLLSWQTVWIFDERFIGGAKWQWGTGQIYGTEVLLWIILLLYLFNIQYSVFNIKKILNIKYLILKHKLKAGLILSIWLFIFYSGLSILWSAAKWPAYYNWFHLLEGAALFFLIIASRIDWKKIMLALALSGSAQALLACWQFFSQTIAANKWLGLAAHQASEAGTIVVQGNFGRYLRAYGTFAHPNILGGFLAVSFLSVLILYFANLKNLYPLNDLRRVWRAWCYDLLLIVSALVLLAGLFFSFSRSAWIALAVAAIFYIIFKLKDRNLFKANIRGAVKICLPILIMLGCLLYIYWPLVFSRVDLSGRLEAKSVQQRLDYYGQAGDVIANHWLLGTGLGNYTYALYRQNPQAPGWSFEPVHNIYLLLFAELGIVGFLIYLFFLAFFIFNIKYSILNINTNSKSIKSVKSSGVYLLAIIIICFFDHYFWTQYVGIILGWLVLALSVKIDNDYEKNI